MKPWGTSWFNAAAASLNAGVYAWTGNPLNAGAAVLGVLATVVVVAQVLVIELERHR